MQQISYNAKLTHGSHAIIIIDFKPSLSLNIYNDNNYFLLIYISVELVYHCIGLYT